jgi:hypothetical protein
VKAVEENDGEYHTFVDEHGKEIVLDRKETIARNELIFKRHKVSADWSEDLR